MRDLTIARNSHIQNIVLFGNSASHSCSKRFPTFQRCGVRWLSRRASGSGARGQRFKIYLRLVVSLSKTLYTPKVLVIPRKGWLRPDITEKLLKFPTFTLRFNNFYSMFGGKFPAVLVSYRAFVSIKTTIKQDRHSIRTDLPRVLLSHTELFTNSFSKSV